MQINKAIRQVMRDKGVSLLSMAKAIGKERGNDVSARLNIPNMTINNVVTMSSKCSMFWAMKSSSRSGSPERDERTRS